MKLVFVLAAFLVSLASISSADVHHDLAPFDSNHDGLLDRDELTAYFRAHDPEIRKLGGDAATKALDHRVNDIMFASPGCTPATCSTVAIAVAERRIEKRMAEADTPEDHHFGWKGLALKRTVTDEADPRQPDSDFPAIFSYTHDRHADRHDFFTFLGAVQLADIERGFGPPATLPNSFVFTPGIELDVQGSRKKNEDTFDVATPVAWNWTRPAKSFFDSLSLALAPEYTTDRAFKRRVWDLTSTFAFSSRHLLKAGFTTRFGPPEHPNSALYWAPALQLELGSVERTGGNEDLEKIRGPYDRIGARVEVSYKALIIAPRLTIGIRAFFRHDLRHTDVRNHHYAETIAMYDVTPSGNVALTATWARGRKPPAFSDTNTFLFGVGVKQK